MSTVNDYYGGIRHNNTFSSIPPPPRCRSSHLVFRYLWLLTSTPSPLLLSLVLPSLVLPSLVSAIVGLGYRLSWLPLVSAIAAAPPCYRDALWLPCRAPKPH